MIVLMEHYSKFFASYTNGYDTTQYYFDIESRSFLSIKEYDRNNREKLKKLIIVPKLFENDVIEGQNEEGKNEDKKEKEEKKDNENIENKEKIESENEEENIEDKKEEIKIKKHITVYELFRLFGTKKYLMILSFCICGLCKQIKI